MFKCPRFNKCEAPLCPLDPDWRARQMIKDERVCHYLSEVSKPNAASRYLSRPDAEFYVRAADEMEEMRKAFPILDKRLRTSSQQNSRIPMVQLEFDFSSQSDV